MQAIIDYNDAHPVEGLKYQQGELISAQAVDLSDPATEDVYEADKASGKASTHVALRAGQHVLLTDLPPG